MQITTDTSVIYDLIQSELDKRWHEILNNSEKLPFTPTTVIKTKDVGEIIYKNFALNVVTAIKEKG